ncbi:MAG: chemotaxis protein CheX [Bdellovibrionales bacterium]|nr:chemotaxis protein CheX [Bdellovibrionales bacterium]
MEFKTRLEGKAFFVEMPASVSKVESDALRGQIKAWLENGFSNLTFDFKDTMSITKDFYAAMSFVKQQLKAGGQQIFSLNLKKSLLDDIKNAGMNQVFNPIGENRTKGTSTKKKLDVSLIEPFIAATMEVLKTQAQVDAHPGKPFLKSTSPVPYSIGIAGVIGVGSSSFTGVVALCFPEKTFVGIYNSMFGESNTELTAEMEDAAGEILNIIYGQAKVVLNDKFKQDLQKALPTVLRGEKLSVRQVGTQTALILPFESTCGLFHIEIEWTDDKKG